MNHEPPSPPLGDSTDLGSRYPVLLRQAFLRSARAVQCGLINRESLIDREFCGNAGLAALRRPVSKHVALVIPMRVPAKVLNAIVRAIPIVVADVCLPRQRGREEGHRDKSMGESAVRLAITFFPKDEGFIPVVSNSPGHQYRFIAPRVARVAPFPGLPSPRTKLPIGRNLIVRKAVHSFPLNYGCTHGW